MLSKAPSGKAHGQMTPAGAVRMESFQGGGGGVVMLPSFALPTCLESHVFSTSACGWLNSLLTSIKSRSGVWRKRIACNAKECLLVHSWRSTGTQQRITSVVFVRCMRRVSPPHSRLARSVRRRLRCEENVVPFAAAWSATVVLVLTFFSLFPPPRQLVSTELLCSGYIAGGAGPKSGRKVGAGDSSRRSCLREVVNTLIAAFAASHVECPIMAQERTGVAHWGCAPTRAAAIMFLSGGSVRSL